MCGLDTATSFQKVQDGEGEMATFTVRDLENSPSLRQSKSALTEVGYSRLIACTFDMI